PQPPGGGGLGHHRQGGLLSHLPQQGPAPVIGPQYPQVGGRLALGGGDQPQAAVEEQAANPGQGVAFGLDPGQNILQPGTGLDRAVEAVVQALSAAVVGAGVLLRHAPQPGKDRPLTVFQRRGGPARRHLPVQHLGGLLWQQLPPALPRQEPPPDGGGGGIRPQVAAVVGRSYSGKSQGLKSGALPGRGPQVLHRQDVV